MSKKKERVRKVPWWRKLGLPAVFGSMLEAASKDDSDAMLAAVKGFRLAFPGVDLFDPSAGGFRIPGEALFGSPAFHGAMVGFGEACVGLHAWDCLFVASATCLRAGPTKGVRLFFDEVSRSANDALSAPSAMENESGHFLSEALTMTMRRIVRLAEGSHLGNACEDAFAGTHAEPFWRRAEAMALADREERVVYEEGRPPESPDGVEGGRLDGEAPSGARTI